LIDFRYYRLRRRFRFILRYAVFARLDAAYASLLLMLSPSRRFRFDCRFFAAFSPLFSRFDFDAFR